jgi:hypothetical protein
MTHGGHGSFRVSVTPPGEDASVGLKVDSTSNDF